VRVVSCLRLTQSGNSDSYGPWLLQLATYKEWEWYVVDDVCQDLDTGCDVEMEEIGCFHERFWTIPGHNQNSDIVGIL